MFPELLDNVAIPVQGIPDTILLAESQWHAAAGTAIADCVEISLVFDDTVNKSSTVAVPEDISGFFFAYLPVIIRPFLNKDIFIESEHYLGTHRIIAIVKDFPASTWPQ